MLDVTPATYLMPLEGEETDDGHEQSDANAQEKILHHIHHSDRCGDLSAEDVSAGLIDFRALKDTSKTWIFHP